MIELREVLGMIADLELKDAIIDSVIVDKQGLYEVFWEVPDGYIYDEKFGYRKERRWESVVEILIDLVEEGFISIIFGNYAENEEVRNNIRGVLNEKENWRPFDIIEGRGFLITKGDELKRRLFAGKSSRQRSLYKE